MLRHLLFSHVTLALRHGGSSASVNEPQLKRMASVVNGELRYWFIRSVGELVKKFKVLALREIG
jgi:hypothetical protein